MKVWKLRPSYNGYIEYEPETLGQFDFVAEKFRGNSIKKEWESFPLIVISKGKLSDCPPALPIKALVFSERAVTKLNLLDIDKIECLPVIMPNEENYFAINVINVLDCLDGDKCKVSRFDEGEIMSYRKFVFKEKEVSNQFIFKIVEHESKRVESDIFVTDQFRDIVLQSGLKGFEFIEVWDSEEKEEPKLELPYSESDPTYTFDETNALLDAGKTVASDKWAMRLNKDGMIEIAERKPDGSYFWMDLMYFPPIFIELEWRVVNID